MTAPDHTFSAQAGASADGAGTFTPSPGAAPLPRQVLTHAGMETRLLLRNGEQVLIALAIPLVVLFAGVLAADRLAADRLALPALGRPVDTLTPGVLALAVLSTGFTSLAIATGFERRYGVLKRLGASPLPRIGLLAGKVGALLAVESLQVVVVCVAAVALGWAPAVTAAGVAGAVATVLLGTAAFASLGLLVAGTLRAEATLAVANLVYLLLLAGGAVVVPAAAYGGAGEVLRLLPSGALGEGMRTALVAGTMPVQPLLVLAGWAVVGGVLTARTFRWE